MGVILHSKEELSPTTRIDLYMTRILCRVDFNDEVSALQAQQQLNRYSTFLVLYPTGITSEVGLIYIALPFIKASDKYCLRMPNKWNFSFDYFYASLLALAIYVPGSPHMYTYMLGQRRKALSKSKKE